MGCYECTPTLTIINSGTKNSRKATDKKRRTTTAFDRKSTKELKTAELILSLLSQAVSRSSSRTSRHLLLPYLVLLGGPSWEKAVAVIGVH